MTNPLNYYKIAHYKAFTEHDAAKKTIDFLKKGDFKSAQTKKLVNTNYFRAKINYTDRLIFTFLKYQHEHYILLLEVVWGHKYEKSKFLKGIYFTESDIDFKKEKVIEIDYMNSQRDFLYVDKFLSLSPEQTNILEMHPPMLIVGSAGSGKTSVTIEKLRRLEGKVLYTSLSKHLVEKSHEICHQYRNIDFLTFSELLNRVERQSKQELTFEAFRLWAYRHKIKEIERYYEEFNGILTGTHEYLYYPESLYLELGVKQSLFPKEERREVYGYFKKFLLWLESEARYSSNVVGYQLLEKVKKRYDFIVIDEIQDFTNMQIYFVYKFLKEPQNFIFTGDSHQILYSNYFSWTNLKAMLLKESSDSTVQILKENHRNAQNITTLANKFLKIKQLRFGSIDKESSFLPSTSSKVKGEIHFIKETNRVIKELNRETQHSVDFAVIVLNEKMKAKLKLKFNTPLLFTVQEAKGLEYKNVILVNFVSENSQKFSSIVSSISKEALEEELNYARQKDKENREIEQYKIYINSLYVAFTRGIENLYIIEKKNHRLFELLGLIEEKKEKISVQKSSRTAWEKEAQQLKNLKKFEQYNKIVKEKLQPRKEKEKITKQSKKPKRAEEKFIKKEKIQKHKPSFTVLKEKVFKEEHPTKSDKDRLFKLAKKENDLETIEQLMIRFNFKSAKLFLKKSEPSPIRKNLLKNPFEVEKCEINLAELFNMNTGISLFKSTMNKQEDLNSRDSEGYTALMLAVRVNHKRIVQLLLEAGADKDLENHGQRAIDMALEKGDKEMLKLFR